MIQSYLCGIVQFTLIEQFVYIVGDQERPRRVHRLIWSGAMKFNGAIFAGVLGGTALLVTTPGVAQAPQRLTPDTAGPPRASLLPQFRKTTVPRATTTEETPTSQQAPAPPLAAPPRSALGK